MILNIQQLKGDPEHLCGELIAYVKIELEEGAASRTPLDGMIQGGLLAVTGDYRQQRNIQDFIAKELKGALDKGLTELMDHLKEMGDVPEDMDVDQIKEKMESLSNLEVIPVPAKVVFFSSEEELLSSPGDIFYLGEFKTPSHAHLAVTSFPILYQARFKEQDSTRIQGEISKLLDQIEKTTAPGAALPEHLHFIYQGKNILSFGENLESFLLGRVLPNLMFHLNNTADFDRSFTAFRGFMDGYRYPEDVDMIQNCLVQYSIAEDRSLLRKVELICSKIAALQAEEFEKLRHIQQEMQALG